MLQLFDRGKPVDLITLTEELQRTGQLGAVGGPAALALLVEQASISANLPAYTKIVRENGARRETIQGAMALAAMASNGATLEVVAARADELTREIKRGTKIDSAEAAVIVNLADVEPERIEWVWPGRIARGKLALIIGNPDLGKSFLALDITARISRGTSWPDGGHTPVGDVVLLSAEDGLSDTIRPRLDGLGADVARVHALTAIRSGDTERAFDLARDLQELAQVIVRRQPTLVVIDPISAYIGKVDAYRDNEVRAVLGPLATLAERYRVAVIGIMHLSKDHQRQAIHRALGSVAFVAAARVVLAVAKDPDNEERRLLTPVKANLSGPVATLAFKVISDSITGLPVTVWESAPVEGVNADMLLGAPQPAAAREERRDAEAFLLRSLACGEVTATHVLSAAEQEGISQKTLKRAKRKLGITSRHEGQPGKGGAWYWCTPNGASDILKRATPEELAPFGKDRKKTIHSTRTSPKGAASVSMAPFGDPLRDDDELVL
jgi:hypothetical protein